MGVSKCKLFNFYIYYYISPLPPEFILMGVFFLGFFKAGTCESIQGYFICLTHTHLWDRSSEKLSAFFRLLNLHKTCFFFHAHIYLWVRRGLEPHPGPQIKTPTALYNSALKYTNVLPPTQLHSNTKNTLTP